MRTPVKAFLVESGTDLSAIEREGFLIITKLRNPMRVRHTPKPSQPEHTAGVATFDAAKRRGTFASSIGAAPSSSSRKTTEEQLAKRREGREWAEIVKLLSPYQEFEAILARRHTLKIVTRQSEQNRLAAK